MNQLSGVSVLIVDDNPETSWRLRDRMVGEGATVHVVRSAKAALLMAERTQVHVAFVPYDRDEKLEALSRWLDLNNIPQVFTASEAAPAERRPPSKTFIPKQFSEPNTQRTM